MMTGHQSTGPSAWAQPPQLLPPATQSRAAGVSDGHLSEPGFAHLEDGLSRTFLSTSTQANEMRGVHAWSWARHKAKVSPCGPQTSLPRRSTLGTCPARFTPGVQVSHPLGVSASELTAKEWADVGLPAPFGVAVTPLWREHCLAPFVPRGDRAGVRVGGRNGHSGPSASCPTARPARWAGADPGVGDARLPCQGSLHPALPLPHSLGGCLCLRGLVRTWNSL